MEIDRIFSALLIRGHFLLSSGLHSPVYFEKFKIFSQPSWVEGLCRMLSGHFREYEVQAVAGPALGGVILAYEVARQLGVKALFLEEVEGEKVLRRNQHVSHSERVLVVDDVLTTGESIKKSIKALLSLGAKVIGVGVLVNRSGGKIDLQVPFFSCWSLSAPVYLPKECPQCKEGLPLIRPGSL